MPVRMTAARILHRVYCSDSYADILVNHLLKDRSLSLPDKSLLSELVYGVLRWRGKLDYLLKQYYRGSWKKLPEKIRVILELGLYQLLYLDRVPPFAAINESVELTKTWADPKWSAVVNAILRNLERNKAELNKNIFPDTDIQSIAVAYSHPEWLVSGWCRDFGMERTVALCKANNEKAPLVLRVNRLQNDPDSVLSDLKDRGFNAVKSSYLEEFIRIDQGGSGIFEMDLFKDGDVTIQDESAGFVSRLTAPGPGERILDMASAPGGKTGHLLELSNRQAVILAMEFHWNRIQLLKGTLRRLRHSDVSIVQADGRKIPGREFDKILLDAPCSGLGVLRKRAELRWRMQPDQIETLVQIQMALLCEAAVCLSDSGTIIYSTCTISAQENHKVVEWFLQTHPDFHIEPAEEWVPPKVVSGSGWIETWPDVHNMDGSFAVRMKKRRTT